MRSSTWNGSVGELPDGEERAADGERVDHRVDAGAVGQAGVDHGRRLVDAATDLADDLVDDAPQVGLVDESVSVTSMLALRSTKTDSGPLTMTSVTARR